MDAGSQRYTVAFLGWLSTVAVSLSFLPALEDRRYLLVGAFFAALVVVTGVLLRRLHIPTLVVLLAQLVVLVEGLALAFGNSLRLGVLPTHATFTGVHKLVLSGVDVSQRYAAPAPRNTGLLLMVVFSIGLVALAVDALAVGIGRVPLSGLPLLALYTIPVAALPEGLPAYAFLPGAACFIAALTADERDRLSHWGRLVTRAPSEASRSVDLSALRETGRRIGLVALSAAVVLPIFVPAFSASILDGNRHAGIGGSGGGQGLSFNDPMVSLAAGLQRKDPVDLLEVADAATGPSAAGVGEPGYLRLTVLDRPGPDAWTADPVQLSATLDLSTVLPGPTGLGGDVDTLPRSMEITLADAFPTDSAWLPVPFDAHVVGAGPDFGYVVNDQTVSARTSDAMDSVTPYDVAYDVPVPTADQIRSSGQPPADIVRHYGEVPAGVPSVVAETARTVTAGAQTPYEQALLLQGFFRDSNAFTYDLNAGYGYGYDAMQQFLEQRRGFCQHFAATMAMMARTLGIPSRVVVGFLQSDHVNAQGRYVFTSDDLHSWPELYFEGVGWVRFEPTPGVSAPFPQYAQRTSAPNPTTSAPTSTSLHDPLASGSSASASAAAVASGGSSNGRSSNGALPSTRWLIVVGLALASCLPGLLRWGLRRSRMTRPVDGATAAEAAWAELRDSMVDLHLPWTGSMTPRARERAVARHLDGDAEGVLALHRLTLGVERARYADTALADALPASDVDAVRAALAKRVARSRRIRAVVLPASLVPDLRLSLERITDRLRRPERLGGSTSGGGVQ